MKLTRTTRSKAGGTFRQGYIRTTYANLVRHFGRPFKGDGHKTDAEWVLKTPTGAIVTIYNWKDGKAYLGKEGLSVSKIREWHIGGRTKSVVEAVREALTK